MQILFQFSLWDSPSESTRFTAWINLSILFMRFYLLRFVWICVVFAFNSLYEILSSLFFFDGRPLNSFNSLYEILRLSYIDNSSFHWNLSILFMRFNFTHNFYASKIYIFFQFSLWDSIVSAAGLLNDIKSFNSLYEIHNLPYTPETEEEILSILFMRFFELAARERNDRFYFQFSLWDSAKAWMANKLWSRLFQFSLWDSFVKIVVILLVWIGLSILFMRFTGQTIGVMIYPASFNSLYEIHSSQKPRKF